MAVGGCRKDKQTKGTDASGRSGRKLIQLFATNSFQIVVSYYCIFVESHAHCIIALKAVCKL